MAPKISDSLFSQRARQLSLLIFICLSQLLCLSSSEISKRPHLCILEPNSTFSESETKPSLIANPGSSPRTLPRFRRLRTQVRGFFCKVKIPKLVPICSCMRSVYENPYENSLKFDHGGGSGGSYLDDRYGGYNRSRSDLGSDPYGKRYDAGSDAGMATVFMLTELWTKNWFCMKILKMHPPIKKGGSQDDKSLVVCFGEMLIDFVPTVGGVSLAEAPALKKAPGGAPANVALEVSRLGGSAGFIGKTCIRTMFSLMSPRRHYKM